MNTGSKKRLCSVICAALCAALFISSAAAALGLITGVKISPKGRITWDDFPGAVMYWLGVDGGYTPIMNGGTISDRIEEPGTYDLEIDAYTENSEKLLAVWTGTVVYDGSTFTLAESEEGPIDTTDESPAPVIAAPDTTRVPEKDRDTSSGIASGPIIITAIIAAAVIVTAVAAVIIVLAIVKRKKQ